MEIGSLADWVAAFGTIAACVIALWLASRQSRPIVSIHSSVWGYSDSDEEPTLMRAVDISIANAGYQTFAVGICMIWIGAVRPAAIEIRGDGPGGPVLLGHGERVTFTFDIRELHSSTQSALKTRRFGKFERRLRRTFRAAVFLSSGEIRTRSLDATARRYLANDALPDGTGVLPRSSKRIRYFKARDVETAT